MDPGETERQTAVREVAEETGYVLAEDDLVGPVGHPIRGARLLRPGPGAAESFYLARVSAFEIDTSAHTEEEQITLQGHRWWAPGRDRGGRVLDLAGRAGGAVGPRRGIRSAGRWIWVGRRSRRWPWSQSGVGDRDVVRRRAAENTNRSSHRGPPEEVAHGATRSSPQAHCEAGHQSGRPKHVGQDRPVVSRMAMLSIPPGRSMMSANPWAFW